MAHESHDCPAGCGAQVEAARFACPSDWSRLPPKLRRRIVGNYRRDVAAHARAMADAFTWYQHNPRRTA